MDGIRVVNRENGRKQQKQNTVALVQRPLKLLTLNRKVSICASFKSAIRLTSWPFSFAVVDLSWNLLPCSLPGTVGSVHKKRSASFLIQVQNFSSKLFHHQADWCVFYMKMRSTLKAYLDGSKIARRQTLFTGTHWERLFTRETLRLCHCRSNNVRHR